MTIASLIRTLFDTQYDADAIDRTGIKSRIKLALALLLLYAAMHLMVGAILHLASSDLPVIEAQTDRMSTD